MRLKQHAFTLIELLVVIAVIAVLMAILMPALQRAKEQGKRTVCHGNLKNLTLAWLMYIDENDGKLVNGAGGFHYMPGGGSTENGSASNIVERAWVGRGWGNNWNNPNVDNTGRTEEQQKQAIREGALWPVANEYGCYKCPTGRRNEAVTYAIVDAMNGLVRPGTSVNGNTNHLTAVGARDGTTVLWVKRRSEIGSPPAAQRMVYIDEGAMTPDSFAVHYNQDQWWDDPPVRHGDGTTVSWADGHVTHLKWSSTETIQRARETRDYYGGGGYRPTTEEGLEEIRQFRKWVWGKIRY
ncbi:MAG: type II secretion system protein [Sedimentisphaerales bacterium]|nr:type II secretion system protein [Sedimentisphaerales bacterium]